MDYSPRGAGIIFGAVGIGVLQFQFLMNLGSIFILIRLLTSVLSASRS